MSVFSGIHMIFCTSFDNLMLEKRVESTYISSGMISISHRGYVFYCSGQAHFCLGAFTQNNILFFLA